MPLLGEFEEQYLKVRAEKPARRGARGARKAPPALWSSGSSGRIHTVEVVDGILYVENGSAGVIALSLADCMVVFTDGFESGDLSAWSERSGAISP